MSDEHEHKHPEHGHHHEHEHAHGNPEPATPTEPVMTEDAGSQALAEALKSSFFIVKVVMVVLVGIFLCSGFFVVGPQQRAIILRLGSPTQSGTNVLLQPGLHWAFPAPIDEVRKIPYAASQTVNSTTGWYYTTPEMEAAGQEPMAGGSLNPATDGYLITADGNIVHSRATLRYRVDDPVKYAFDFTSSSNSVQDALDNALVFAASQFTVDDILTRQVSAFRAAVERRVVELTQKQDVGIVVEQCDVRSIPPRTLMPAFAAVANALASAESMRNAAQSEASQILGRATVNASSITNAAQTERLQLVESLGAEAKSFTGLLPQYKSNPAFVRNILLSQKLAEVLTNVQDAIYLPERADGQKRELRLMLSREPKAPKPTGPATNQ